MRSRFFEKKRNRCNFSPWGRKCFVCLPPLLVTFLQQHLSLILISCRVAKSRRSIWHRCSTKTEEKTGNLQIHMIYYEICNLIWSLKAFFSLDSFDFFDQWLFTIYICLYIYFFSCYFQALQHMIEILHHQYQRLPAFSWFCQLEMTINEPWIC